MKYSGVLNILFVILAYHWSRCLKVRLTYLRLVLACVKIKASTKWHKEKLDSFEKKLWTGVQCELRNFQKEKKNEEIQRLYDKPDNYHFLRSKRFEWTRHVWRAKERLTNKVMIGIPRRKDPCSGDRGRDGLTG